MSNTVITQDGTQMEVKNEVLQHCATLRDALLDPTSSDLVVGQTVPSMCSTEITKFVLDYVSFHVKNPMSRNEVELTKEEEEIERTLWCCEQNIKAKKEKYSVKSPECTEAIAPLMKYMKNQYTAEAEEYDRTLFSAIPDDKVYSYFEGAQMLGAEADRNAPFSREEMPRSDAETTLMKNLFDRFLHEFGERIRIKDCYDSRIGGLHGERAANLRRFVGYDKSGDKLPSQEEYAKAIEEYQEYFYKPEQATTAAN
jgi:hypothetical protein